MAVVDCNQHSLYTAVLCKGICFYRAGAFADSPTGLPHIAEVDGMANCLSVLGCGGNGITFSMVAAQLARHWVAGRIDPDADLFR